MRNTLLLLVLIIGFSSCKKNNRAIVISKIQSASKLATTETTLDKLILGTQERKFLGLIHLNETRFVAYSQAFVKTGIDLSKITAEDVTIKDNSITLKLPAVQVLNFSYPDSTFKIDSNVTDTHAFLNNLDIKDFEEFYRLAELDIRNNLAFMGIKEATERKTRIMLTSLLNNLGYDEVYISYKDGKFIEEIKLPQSSEDDEEPVENKKDNK